MHLFRAIYPFVGRVQNRVRLNKLTCRYRQLPSNVVLRYLGARVWLTVCVSGWGAAQLGMGFVPNWGLLALTRVLLGVFEVIGAHSPLMQMALIQITGWIFPSFGLHYHHLVYLFVFCVKSSSDQISQVQAPRSAEKVFTTIRNRDIKFNSKFQDWPCFIWSRSYLEASVIFSVGLSTHQRGCH